MLVGCVADWGKPLFHVQNSVNACCFSVRSHIGLVILFSLSICGGLGLNSQYLFLLFSFCFVVLVCFLFWGGLWVAAGCDVELVTSMFE